MKKRVYLGRPLGSKNKDVQQKIRDAMPSLLRQLLKTAEEGDVQAIMGCYKIATDEDAGLEEESKNEAVRNVAKKSAADSAGGRPVIKRRAQDNSTGVS